MPSDTSDSKPALASNKLLNQTRLDFNNAKHPTSKRTSEILDVRVRPDGTLEYLARSQEYTWRTDLPTAQTQAWLNSHIESAAATENNGQGISIDRIIGNDSTHYLIAWKRHPETGAQIEPFWYAKTETDQEMIDEWWKLLRSVREGLEASRLSEEEFLEERGLEVPRIGDFVGILRKPVVDVVRRVVEERWPGAFEE